MASAILLYTEIQEPQFFPVVWNSLFFEKATMNEWKGEKNCWIIFGSAQFQEGANFWSLGERWHSLRADLFNNLLQILNLT